MVDEPPQDVRPCRLENCKQEGMIKVVFALDDKIKEMRILEAFRVMGAQVTEGMPPSGYMEEEISAWTDALNGKLR
eukprot:2720558-Pyramimonas_sp.AAC.1